MLLKQAKNSSLSLCFWDKSLYPENLTWNTQLVYSRKVVYYKKRYAIIQNLFWVVRISASPTAWQLTKLFSLKWGSKRFNCCTIFQKRWAQDITRERTWMLFSSQCSPKNLPCHYCLGKAITKISSVFKLTEAQTMHNADFCEIPKSFSATLSFSGQPCSAPAFALSSFWKTSGRRKQFTFNINRLGVLGR